MHQQEAQRRKGSLIGKLMRQWRKEVEKDLEKKM